MEFLKGELVGLIYQLLPGFMAAWIFYSLTAHRPKESPFERTIQALIFTTITQAFVIPLGWLLIRMGRKWLVLGEWNQDSAFVTAVVVAGFLGFAFSALANSGKFHDLLPDWITKRTSYPSEWFSALNRDKRYVILHLTGERRLYGWPNEWPDHPSSGHFVINEPQWILDSNELAPLLMTERMLVPATEVVMVEFEKWPAEQTFDWKQFKRIEKKLVKLRKGDESANKRRGRKGSLREGG